MFEGKMMMTMVKDDEEGEIENYVGRTVKKFFLGFGFFHGKVISFNRARKFYRVKYNDGDREELDLKELKEVLADNHQSQPQPQPLQLSSFVEKPKGSSRRGRKRRRDSSEKDGISRALGERQHDNVPGEDSPLRLEEVNVLNAQTKEIYRQLRGSNEGGKDGNQQGDELLLEPLVPVRLVHAFEASIKQCDVDHPGEDEGNRMAKAYGNGNPVPENATASCRLKRTRVSPTSDTGLQQQQIPSVEEEMRSRNGEGEVEKTVDETAMTIADMPPHPVGTEGDSSLSDVDTNLGPGKDQEGVEGYEQEEKTQFSEFMLSLPPSSRSLGELDNCVAELFQVYSLLRSFSNMIFLSPFSLEEFAYSLISIDVCALTDSIYLSLLQMLRRQLERLSRNGSKSATFTLRLSDWSLLDYITWPSFLVGYMLTQGFTFDRGQSFVKTSLLTPVEYYKLPVRAKMAILSFLCDKVLDTDEARAELARRVILENDPETMETKGFSQKKQVKESTPEKEHSSDRSGTVKEEASVHGVSPETLSPSGPNAIRVGRHLDEDGNLDECVLCAMDGNLICCDGCPAAYHSRCVGVTKQGLPLGDWFCPECRADKHDSRGARISKRVREGELLAIGPENQLFYNTCGYLLISESGPDGKVMHRYYSPRDIHTVVQLLEEAGQRYYEIWNAVKQLCQLETRSRTASETFLKDSVLEIPPSLVFCSGNEASHMERQCNSSPLVIGDVPAEAEKPFPPDSLISEPTKESADLPYSHMYPTIADSKPVIRPGILPLQEEHDVKQMLNANDASTSHTNGLQLSSDVVGPFTGEAENKPHVCSDQPRLQCGFTDNSLSAELESIWRQHTCDDSSKQVSLQWTNSQSNEQMEVEGKIENATQFAYSLSTGVIAVVPDRSGSLSVGDVDEGKTISITMAQQELSGDLVLKPVSASPGKPSVQEQFPEQRDVSGGLGKRATAGHFEGGRTEREVDYLSTITQINACSYTNKYANCDLVATAAFNLAVMAGGVDDLVDDKSGTMKKSKPSSVADQMKAFTQASSHFFWPSVKKRGKDVPKEKCGWCINCRLTIRRGCLLTQVAGQMAGGAAIVVGGIRSLKGGTGHFPAVAAYILYIEDNLHGLLVGPWEYSGHRKKWRKNVEQAKSLSDVKLALLEMESSMRKVVLSPDWDKVEEDSPESIASSAVIISNAGVPAGKKSAPTRKRGRPTVVAKPPPMNSYDGACFGVKWWRGGSLSRQVYNWESLTKTSLRRAGRQGGFKEIPDLIYSKSSDLSRRTRRFAWRTRVEKISSIAQVAVEVRYLDTFIKWNDIISPLEATTTHHIKGPAESDPTFHKAEIRMKKEEDGIVQYLLVFATDKDENLDTPTQQQQEVVSKGVGASAEKPNNKKHKAAAKEGANDVWVTESQVPPFLLKVYVEKLRTENQIELPKSLKKGKLKGSNQQKKLSFWKLLCSPRLAGVLKNPKPATWVCGHCSLTCSQSQHVTCQRCSGHFHRKCTQVEDSIDGQEDIPVCKNCIQLRQGHRMRKPSYKMLVMHSQLSDGTPACNSKEVVVADMDEVAQGRVKLRWKKDKASSTSPPDCKLFGRKKKKRLLSVPTPSQLDCESIWTEKKGKKIKMKKKGFTTVFPCQYEGEPTRMGKKKKKRALPIEEESDLPQPKKRGRKKKGISSSPSQAERKIDPPPQERRTSGRIRKVISPNAAISLSITEQHQVPRRYKKKYKLDKESPEKSISTRRKTGRRRKSLAAGQNDEDEVGIRSPLKRKRLKIIFDGLEVAGKDADNSDRPEEGQERKSGNGLDFGTKSLKSEAEIHRFRQEKVVLEGQVGLDEGKLPRCGLCSEPYSPVHVYVSCEYCEGCYHGAAVGLRQGDAPYLVGFKCHRCRKCRAPTCPIRQNVAGVRTRRRSAIDHGEVIDAENMNMSGQGPYESVSLQSSWFSSPDKEFSAAFSDAKAFPDFVAATNQAEEALAADGSNFGHDVLSNNFDMSDLVLAGDSQVQLNPLSLEDQQVNVWANNESSQLHLPAFSVSQADLSSAAAPSLSFTELLASEDDLFEGVASTGLVLSAEWTGGMYGSGSLVPPRPPPADTRPNAGVDNYSSIGNANGASSGSGTLVTQFKTPATDITTTAGIDKCSSFANVHGPACQTTLALEQCGNTSIEEIPFRTVLNGDNELLMNRITPSPAR